MSNGDDAVRPPDRAMTPLSQPWLSVLIPTHGGERWLAATLDSLAAQTRQGFECILLDSSDTEETSVIAERYRQLLRIHVERRRDILDWQGKTNVAAGMAAAEHLSMLHQDDLWEPHRAESIANWIASAPDVDMHLHPSWIVDAAGHKLGLWRCPLPPDAIVRRAVLLERLIVQNFVAICAPVIRTEMFSRLGGLDRSLWYTADWDLYLKIARLGSVRYHPEPLCRYRIHDEALTVVGSRDAAGFAEQLRIVLDRHIDAIAPARRSVVRARAEAAIAVNVALSRALHGGASDVPAAMMQVIRLGPRSAHAFFRDSRLFERVLPRARSLLARRRRSSG